MVARTVSGGFGGSQWSQTGDPWFQLDIYQRFDAARRNDDGSMHDHLKMYKDCVVVIGTAANGLSCQAGLLWPFRRNYPDFIDACNRGNSVLVMGGDCGEDVAAGTQGGPSEQGSPLPPWTRRTTMEREMELERGEREALRIGSCEGK